MATSAELIQELNDDLTLAYDAIADKGGVISEKKNSHNLAEAINSIPSYSPSHNIPYFDGGQYGTIAYLLPGETEIKYYTAKSATDLSVCSQYEDRNMIITTLEDGTLVTRPDVLAYSIGTQDANVTKDYFLANFVNLEFLYGLETSNISSIGNYFLQYCRLFNHRIELPESLSSIGDEFISRCASYNQPVVIPSSVKSIGDSFLRSDSSFNQPITFMGSDTSFGEYFLYGCYAFNQTITLPSSLKSVSGSYLNDCYSYNQPIVLPSTVASIGRYFLQACYSFNNSVILPDGLQTIEDHFMANCRAFHQPLSFPDTVTSIGNYLLSGCYAFIGPLNVGRASGIYSSNNMLATSNEQSLQYTIGITLTGANAQVWKDGLPDRDTNPYRKLKVA